MKKIIMCFAIIFICISINDKSYVIPNEAIRLRVIPNSNDKKDIVMKERVIEKLLPMLDFSEKTIEKTREDINADLKKIDDSIENTFKQYNYNEKYIINYGPNEFPEKTYKGIKYKAGTYESLIIEIGEAKGNNYWCVLYPPLCMVDNSLSKNEYKSKTIEIINRYFSVK